MDRDDKSKKRKADGGATDLVMWITINDDEHRPSGAVASPKDANNTGKNAASYDHDEHEAKTIINKLLTINLWKGEEKAHEALNTLLDLFDAEYMATDSYICDAFWKANGLFIVLSVMRKYPNSHKMQWLGCVCLCNSLWAAKTKIRGCQQVACGTDTMEYVVDLLTRFQGTACVVMNAISLLAAWCDKNSGAATKFAVTLNGAPLVISAMKSFSMNVELQSWGCHLFRILSEFDELKDTLSKSKVRSALPLRWICSQIQMTLDIPRRSRNLEKKLLSICRLEKAYIPSHVQSFPSGVFSMKREYFTADKINFI
jgi:hypothetical protein